MKLKNNDKRVIRFILGIVLIVVSLGYVIYLDATSGFMNSITFFQSHWEGIILSLVLFTIGYFIASYDINE